MRLRTIPHVTGNPEDITSPKEYLSDAISKASQGEKFYINTKHNVIISQNLSTDKAYERCSSFRPFYDFIKLHYPVFILEDKLCSSVINKRRFVA